jgi:hypothetical protein
MVETTQAARTTQTAQTAGVGVADLQQAALAEARRLMREAGGDRRVATGLVFERLHDLGWVSAPERDVLQKMHEVGASAARQEEGGKGGRPDAARAYLEVREMYHTLLTRGDASPVALVLAAGAVGSYEPVPGDDGTTVVYAKSNRSYQGILGGAGAIIGGAIGGAPGAAIGGAIGGVVGTIVDDCKD